MTKKEWKERERQHAEKVYQIVLEKHRRDYKKFVRKIKPVVAILLLTILLSSCGNKVAWAEITPLTVAQSQIGLGEIGGNNKGKYIKKYLNGQEGLPWCAGFISYCLKKANVDFKYTLRAKDFLKIGKPVTNPQAGDLIVFTRKGGGHIGIIEKVTKDKIITIEGNTGKYPSVVKRIIYARNNIPNLIGLRRLK